MVGRNVLSRLGEVDLLAKDRAELIVVEVKTIIGDGSPLVRIDAAKASRLWTLAHSVGASRVEHIGLRLLPAAVEVEWLPG